MAHLWSPIIADVVAATILAGVVARYAWRRRPTTRLRDQLGSGGWLDYRGVRESAGVRAMRGQASAVRPGLTGKHPASAFGARVGSLVSGPWWVHGRSVYSAWSRGILVVGPQGSGKSSWLGNQILDAPGAAYVTSTKTELAALTADLRREVGPVEVFNPTGLGGLHSTFGWDPVADCLDPAVADARARAFVRGGGGVAGAENAEFWAGKAAEIIRCYLLAAALQGADMGTVMDWALHPDDSAPVTILERSSNLVPPGWVGTLSSNLAAAPNTKSGYFAAVVPAVTFMDNALVAAACRPAPGTQFDIERFLLSFGTVYVVAGEDDRRIAPLLTALTEAVFASAKRVAAQAPAGRLDPPFALFLDEIANITPVPLDTWAADSRGWGITVCAVAQDLAQLQTRWGHSRAQTIFSNLPTRVILPGVAIKEDLEALAYLGGHRDVRQTSEHSDAEGSRPRSRTTSYSREAVITGHTIYALPRWHAYVLGLGIKPAVVRFQPTYQRVNAELRRRARRRARRRPALPTEMTTIPETRTAAPLPESVKEAA